MNRVKTVQEISKQVAEWWGEVFHRRNPDGLLEVVTEEETQIFIRELSNLVQEDVTIDVETTLYANGEMISANLLIAAGRSGVSLCGFEGVSSMVVTNEHILLRQRKDGVVEELYVYTTKAYWQKQIDNQKVLIVQFIVSQLQESLCGNMDEQKLLDYKSYRQERLQPILVQFEANRDAAEA